MDVAPAAAEVAVVTGAVVQGACMQLYAAAAAWVWQQAACVAGYAGVGGRGHDRNGWQAASVHAAVGSGWCAAERRVCSNVQWQLHFCVAAGGEVAVQMAAVDSCILLTC
jgi:hypothetical protein